MAKMEDGLMAPQIQTKPQVFSFPLLATVATKAVPAFVVATATIGQVRPVVITRPTCSLARGMLSRAAIPVRTGFLFAVSGSKHLKSRRIGRIPCHHQS
jgi:hypothetical protein